MTKIINLDCDGTFINLYGVNGWLDDLINEDVRPYREAKPLVNLVWFARTIHELQNKGWKVNIISWTSKNGTKEYNARVKQTKLEWFETHIPSVKFDNVYIVDYGTPKTSLDSSAADSTSARYIFSKSGISLTTMLVATEVSLSKVSKTVTVIS